MARRPLAGRDKKIIQGHRRDEFFARMRRKGGAPRAANQAPAVAREELEDATPVDETASGAATAAEGEATEPAQAEGG